MDISELVRTAQYAHQQGDVSASSTLCKKILQIDSNEPRALNLLGVIYFEQNQFETATPFFQKAIFVNPSSYVSYFYLGHILKSQRKFNEALSYYQKALELSSGEAEILTAIAETHIENDNHAEAIVILKELIIKYPQSHHLHFKIASAYSALHENEKADLHFFYAKIYNPENIHHTEKMAAYCDEFLSKNPLNTEIYIQKGLIFESAQNYLKAIDIYNQALAINPHLAEAFYRRGNAEDAIGLYQEALKSYDHAIDIDAHHQRAIMHRGITHLRLGHYTQGWQDYESRLADTGDSSLHLGKDYSRFKHNEWDGQIRQDDCLLLWSEQGIGDEVMYASMFNDVLPYFYKVFVMADRRICELLSRSFPQITVIAKRDLHAYNFPADRKLWHLPCGSLGKFLRKTKADFNSNKKFLIADQKKTERFLQQYKTSPRTPLVGIAWKSLGAMGKSIPLIDLSHTLGNQHFTYVCLQYQSTLEDQKLFEDLTAKKLHIPDVDLYDQLDDLAALINACDYIITCSNITVHLAGGLGKKAFVLIPKGNGLLWYCGIDQPKTPWYDSLELVRQTQPGDWNSALNGLKKFLAPLSADFEENA